MAVTQSAKFKINFGDLFLYLSDINTEHKKTLIFIKHIIDNSDEIELITNFIKDTKIYWLDIINKNIKIFEQINILIDKLPVSINLYSILNVLNPDEIEIIWSYLNSLINIIKKSL